MTYSKEARDFIGSLSTGNAPIESLPESQRFGTTRRERLKNAAMAMVSQGHVFRNLEMIQLGLDILWLLELEAV